MQINLEFTSMKIKAFAVATALITSSQFAIGAEHFIQMKNSGADGPMVFEPSVLHVEIGDTVHFEPTDVAHNSQSIADLIPEGSEGWKGGMNKKVSFTVDKEGVYVYKCRPHTVMGMVGVIVAGNPTNIAEVKSKATSLSDTFILNKDRLTQYLNQID